MTSDNVTKKSLYVNNNEHAPQTKRVNEVGFNLIFISILPFPVV